MKRVCLPADPLERHLREGVKEEKLGRGPFQTFKKEWVPFLVGGISGKPLLVT
jgi:hypothetical protein